MAGAFEGIAYTSAPCTGFLDTMGFDEMSSSAGMTSVAVDTWGPTFAAVKQLQSSMASANTVSSSYAEWALPSGAQSCFLNYLALSDGSSVDCFGVHSNGTEIWLNRIAWGQFS